MISQDQIIEAVRKVASAKLGQASFEAVLTEPASDSEGREAVRITIVVRPGWVTKLEGNDLLDTLVEIRRKLQKLGEERFPLVEYATKQELEQRGDSES
jgi:hypothetical protein